MRITARQRRRARRKSPDTWLLFTLLALLPSRIAAQDSSQALVASGAIAGRVESRAGDPARDAVITIDELAAEARADEQGGFRFDHVLPGRYVLHVTSRLYGTAVREVSVLATSETRVDIQLDLVSFHDEIEVRAGADSVGLADAARKAAVLDGRDLDARIQPTLGDTLSSVPGVTSTSYAAGASRPVVRGFGGDRVRILEDGLGVGDASGGRDEYAAGGDPLGAKSIEIVRGSSALLYGTNAVAGIVNVDAGRVPESVPHHRVGGAANGRAGTNADELGASFVLDGGWQDLAWTASMQRRRADVVHTPEGPTVNSDLDTEQTALGASWILDRGYGGAALQKFDTEYGIPTERRFRVAMKRRGWNAAGELRSDPGVLSGVRVRVGRLEIDQAERLSSGESATASDIRAWEARVEAPHAWADAGKGVLGLQFSDREAVVAGSLPYLPSNTTRSRAAFAFEEWPVSPVTFELGGRWEGRDVEAAGTLLPARSFHGLSVSGGLVWRREPAWSLGLTLSRCTRLPTADELYANGPHLATFQYEIGDPGLVEEVSSSWDLSLQRSAGRVTGTLNLFASNLNDYIFLTPTGNTIQVDREEVPEYITLQDDAQFRGAEGTLSVEVMDGESKHVRIEMRIDMVRAEIVAAGRPLPRIPPVRTALAFQYDGSRSWARLEALHVAGQQRVALFEAPTDGYTMLGVSGGIRLESGSVVHDVIIAVTNLTDQLARNHVSSLKEISPLPGRNVSVGYKLLF